VVEVATDTDVASVGRVTVAGTIVDEEGAVVSSGAFVGWVTTTLGGSDVARRLGCVVDEDAEGARVVERLDGTLVGVATSAEHEVRTRRARATAQNPPADVLVLTSAERTGGSARPQEQAGGTGPPRLH
jgi:hypothetical protein